MRTSIICLLAAMLAAIGCRAGATMSALTLSPCQVPGGKEIISCGRLDVPENWGKPGGRQISLNIMVLPKLGSGPEQAPMVWLDGGPGVASTNTAALYTGEFKFHRDRRAIVMIDQRGTGGSGALNCPKIERQSPLADPWTAVDVQSCRRVLATHADLAQYSTVAAARDLDAVRSALGYEKVDLAGLSYGTMLAQTYMDLYPGHVRSVALIGSVPIGEKLPLHHAANGQRALRQVFEDCRSDAICNAAFPRLASEWAALQQRLSKAPFVIRDGQDRLLVRKGPFNEFIRGMMNTPEGQRRLPLMISRTAHGDDSLLLKAVKGQGTEPGSEGLYLSVTCPEMTRRIRPVEIGPAVAGASFGRYRIDQQIAACRLWPTVRPAPRPRAPVRSDIPVLLLSGGRDATTPTAWARQIAASLPNSRVLVFDYMTHLPVGLENMDCVDRVMDAFFSKASAQGLDAGCRASMAPPPFEVAPF